MKKQIYQKIIIFLLFLIISFSILISVTEASSTKAIMLVAGYDDADTEKASTFIEDFIDGKEDFSGTYMLLDTSTDSVSIILTKSDSSSTAFKLSDYPEPFIELSGSDIKEDVAIVLGENALSREVIAASTIQSNLVFKLSGEYTKAPGGTTYFGPEIEEIQDKNLILVGGSWINRVTAQILNLPYPTSKDSQEWQSITSVDRSGRAVIMLLDSPYGTVEPVCGDDLCEFGETVENCPSDCNEPEEEIEIIEEPELEQEEEQETPAQTPPTETNKKYPVKVSLFRRIFCTILYFWDKEKKEDCFFA